MNGDEVMWYSPVSLTTDVAGKLGINPELKNSYIREMTGKIETRLGIRNVIDDSFHELTLDFEGNYAIVLRVYNDGIAYRWKTSLRTDLVNLNVGLSDQFAGLLPASMPDMERLARCA